MYPGYALGGETRKVCGRFALDDELDELLVAFVVAENRYPDWQPRFNIAPSQTIPIVIEREKGRRELGPAAWSLIPPWSSTRALKYPTFNARSETAGEKPTFRDSVKRHRCLVPMSGYYEWATREGVKTPHYIYPDNAATLAAAGLYSWWTDPGTGTTLATATILTRASAGSVAHIHDRMPVFVEASLMESWLDPQNAGGAELVAAASEHTLEVSIRLRSHPVAPLRGDSPGLTAEVRG